jgi:hypothetical protein
MPMKKHGSFDRSAWEYRPRQAFLLVPLAAGLAALLLCCLSLGQAIGSTARSPVYSVSGLRARLVRQPQQWLGRTVLVRGIAEVCLDSYGETPDRCLAARLRLEDANRPAMVAPLLLVAAPANPLVVRLRRVPVLGRLVPAPQVLPWGIPATFRIQLRTPRSTTCDLTAPCYEALLLDATPGMSQER